MPAIVTAILGNIVQQPDCDAIVNSANPRLLAGSGVCGVIHKAAGAELERYAMQFAPLQTAQAITTPGFNLPNRLVIHCVGPRYHFDPAPAANLALCLENTLKLAEAESISRIAIPAISMGIYGYPPEEAAPILVAKAFEHARKTTQLEKIRFVLSSAELQARFIEAIDLHS